MQPVAFSTREGKRISGMKYQISLLMLSMDDLHCVIKGEPYYKHEKKKIQWEVNLPVPYKTWVQFCSPLLTWGNADCKLLSSCGSSCSGLRSDCSSARNEYSPS